MKKLLTLALSLLMIMSVCLTGAIAEEGSVVIENNGRTTTYNSVPERVVVLSYSNAETMAALGLEDKVVGRLSRNVHVRRCSPRISGSGRGHAFYYGRTE